MRGRFRAHPGNWLTGGIQFAILCFAAQTNATQVWPYALAAIAVASFAAWIGSYRRLRQIADTPTSKIASAAQGYVELCGRAEEPGGTALTSRLTHLPCVWFRYEIHEKSSDDKWSLTDSGESDDPFVIKDATGKCVIDPAHAEILCSHKQTWTQGDRRYTEWLLLPREQIYALGEFVTIGGANSELDVTADIGTLLSEWKQNRPELMRRFDLNQDGALDLREWELARRQARRETEAQHREIRMSDGTHVMRNPADGRLFLISNYLPDKLRNSYLIWSWVHIMIFLGAGGLSVALFNSLVLWGVGVVR